MRAQILNLFITGIFLLLFAVGSIAAPFWGEPFLFAQPDGSKVEVVVYGDEFYQRVETPLGQPLIRNDKGWIVFAALNAEGAFVPTEWVYSTQTDLKSVNLTYQGAKESQEVIAQKVARNKSLREKQGIYEKQASLAERSTVVEGEMLGLTLLIDFADRPANKPVSEIEDFVNKKGYTGSGNNGSVYDFYYDISDGKLNYTNAVVGYVRAPYDKNYYDNPELQGYDRVKELLDAVLDSIDSEFDFSSLTLNKSNHVIALNIMYAGAPEAGWGNGLWPHAGSINRELDGVTLRRYQMTNIPDKLSIGTFCHENGHSICGWPDLYDYDGDSKGAGRYCLMSSGGNSNPIVPNAYLRSTVGWETIYDISDLQVDTWVDVFSNKNYSVVYKNPLNESESYVIESRVKKGRNTNLPDEGLLIWHIDTRGGNSNQQMTLNMHYYASVVQADNKFDLEMNVNSGDTSDLFKAGYRDRFGKDTKPIANWWDGSFSGLQIDHISEVADTMHFQFRVSNQEMFMPLKDSTGLMPGVNYAFRDGLFFKLPDFEEQNIVSKGVSNNFDIGHSFRTDYYAMAFSGVVYVERDGEYQLKIENEDGARLFLDNKLILQNDGVHFGVQERVVSLNLKKGYYPVRVEFFEFEREAFLDVQWLLPGTDKFVSIPSSNLFRYPDFLDANAVYDSIAGIRSYAFSGSFKKPEELISSLAYDTNLVDAFEFEDENADGIKYETNLNIDQKGDYTFLLHSKSSCAVFMNDLKILQTVKGAADMDTLKIALREGFHPIVICQLTKSIDDSIEVQLKRGNNWYQKLDSKALFVPNTTQRPFKGNGFVIPGLIPLVDYDKGGNGVAYEDRTVGNQFNFYRHGDVDIDRINNPFIQYTVGSIMSGEYLKFTIDTFLQGYYEIEMYAASRFTGNYLNLYLDNQKLTKMGVLNSGSDTVYKTFIRKDIFLPGGRNKEMLLDFHGANYNVAYVKFSRNEITHTKNELAVDPKLYFNVTAKQLVCADSQLFGEKYVIHNLSGQLVQQGIITSTIPFQHKTGLYILSIPNVNDQKSFPFIQH